MGSCLEKTRKEGIELEYMSDFWDYIICKNQSFLATVSALSVRRCARGSKVLSVFLEDAKCIPWRSAQMPSVLLDAMVLSAPCEA